VLLKRLAKIEPILTSAVITPSALANTAPTVAAAPAKAAKDPLANNIANFFRGLAIGFRDLAQMPVIKQLLQLAGIMLKIVGAAAGAIIDPFVKAGAQSQSSALASSSANAHLQGLSAASNAAKAAKAEKDAKARAAAIVKSQKANTAELKKQALTKKQSALFDMEQIQLIAALKGNISKEDKLRLELQLALITGNTTEADKLSKQLAMAIDSTGNLAKYLTTLPDANNPFKSWDAFLDSVLAKAKLAAQISGVSTGSVTNLGLSGSESIPHGNTPVTPISSISSGGTAVGFNGAGQITVNVGGSVVSEQDLIDAILIGIQNKSLSGSPSAIGRISGMFG
jgi:hypothetical protein